MERICIYSKVSKYYAAIDKYQRIKVDMKCKVRKDKFVLKLL